MSRIRCIFEAQSVPLRRQRLAQETRGCVLLAGVWERVCAFVDLFWGAGLEVLSYGDRL